MNEIKHCPFCGSHKLEFIETEIACDECGGVFKVEVISKPQEELLNNEE